MLSGLVIEDLQARFTRCPGSVVIRRLISEVGDEIETNVPSFAIGSMVCDIQIMGSTLLRQVLQPLVRDRSSLGQLRIS